MGHQLTDQDLENVVGGSVNLSEKKNKIGFDTIGEAYTLKCTFKEAKTLVLSMFADYTDVTEREFDILVRDEFLHRNWI